MIRTVLEWLGAFAAAALAALLIRRYLFALVRVKGHSMKETLADGDWLFCTAYDARFGRVRRGSVVICRYPGRGLMCFVKRCVAVPGDIVYRSGGVTHVAYMDGLRAVDIALDAGSGYARRRAGGDYPRRRLGIDEYFVVGDNRGNSHDSRDWYDARPGRRVGPVRRRMIIAHVRRVLWPSGRRGAVE